MLRQIPSVTADTLVDVPAAPMTFDAAHLTELIGRRILLRGQFIGPVTLDGVEDLGGTFSLRVRSPDVAGSVDSHRRPDRHETAERQHVRVAQPDAPVRDAARQEIGPVGAVDADEAAGRPVRRVGRPRAGPERNGAVLGAAVAR